MKLNIINLTDIFFDLHCFCYKFLNYSASDAICISRKSKFEFNVMITIKKIGEVDKWFVFTYVFSKTRYNLFFFGYAPFETSFEFEFEYDNKKSFSIEFDFFQVEGEVTLYVTSVSRDKRINAKPCWSDHLTATQCSNTNTETDSAAVLALYVVSCNSVSSNSANLYRTTWLAKKPIWHLATATPKFELKTMKIWFSTIFICKLLIDFVHLFF